MPVVKGGVVKKKVATAEEIMRVEAEVKQKKRDRRGPLRRFLDRLPVWWRELNENNTSLYLFHERSRVRRAAWRLIRWKWFDRIVIAAIFINCAFLAMYDPLSPADSSWNRMLDLAELAFTFFFAVEFLVQIVARNFLIGPGAYLKNPWFALDFVIVITGLISFFAVLVGMSGGGNVSGIRTLRTLRPLKTITGFPGMQVIVSTILDSVKLVASALVLLVWLFFIFGVVGIDQYAGKLTHRCYSDPGGIALVQEETNSPCDPFGVGRACSPAEFCLNSGEAPNHGYTNFDDIAWSSLTVFQTLTRRGWWHVMEQLEDATGNAVVAKLFFTLVVVFGSFFAASLVTAVIVAEYAKVSVLEEKTGARAESKEMRLMFRRLNRTPWYVKTKRFFAERWTYQRPFRALVRHPRFDTFVTLLILVSTAAMAAEHHGMDPEHASLLETANTLMTLAFALEMVLKLIGLGVVEYSSDRFNRFDAFIVVVGVVELAGAGAGISALRALRLLRVLRSLKILRRFRRMRVLMENVARGVGAMRDFLLVLFLFLFIFTILGMQLFGGSDGFAGERKNFDSFWNSFLIVFEVLTASDWQKVMWRAMRGTGASASAFFVAWIFVGHFIFLDLLLAILTFNFSRETEDERLEREEREHLETETTGGEKRGLDKTAGGEVVMDRMIRRKNRKFADQADAMRRWLRETDQMYGDDPISDTDSDDDAAEEKRIRREARELEELAYVDDDDAAKRDDDDHDDADDGADEKSFDIDRVDPRARLSTTIKSGVAIPTTRDQLEAATRNTIRVHGSARPLDAFRKAARTAVLAQRFAGDRWNASSNPDPTSTAADGDALDVDAVDIEGLDGKALEDEVLRRDAVKTEEARRRRMSMVSRLLTRKKTKREAAEEEAAAQAAAGSRRNLLDNPVDARAIEEENVLGHLVTDSLARAEARGTLTKEELARRMGWDDFLDAVEEEDEREDERDSHLDDGASSLTGGSSIGFGSAAASRFGFGALAAAAFADDDAEIARRRDSRASSFSAASQRPDPEREAALVRSRQAATGGYQDEGVHPAVAAQLAALGVADVSDVTKDDASSHSPSGSRSRSYPPGTPSRAFGDENRRGPGPGSNVSAGDGARAPGLSVGAIVSAKRVGKALRARRRKGLSAAVGGRDEGADANRSPSQSRSPGERTTPSDDEPPSGREHSPKPSPFASEVRDGSGVAKSDRSDSRHSPLRRALDGGVSRVGFGAVVPPPDSERSKTMGKRARALGARGGGEASIADQLRSLGGRRDDPTSRDETTEPRLRRGRGPGRGPGRGRGPGPVTERYHRSATAEQPRNLSSVPALPPEEERALFGPSFDAALERRRAGPVTESYDGGGRAFEPDGGGEKSMFQRMSEARARGAARRDAAMGGPSAGGRAFAALMAGGAGVALGRRDGAPRATSPSPRATSPSPRATSPSPLASAESSPRLAPSDARGSALNLAALGASDANAVPPLRLRDVHAAAGASARSSAATGDEKTQRVAREMMQRIEARRSKKTTIPPVIDADRFLPQATEDLTLPLLGAMARGSARSTKRRMDGVPDRDVVVHVPPKLAERPKFQQKKEDAERLLGGAEPPPVYMKHRSLFLFSPQSGFRRVVFMMSFDKKFEYVILALILVSSAALAVDDPSTSPDSSLGRGLEYLDLSLTVVFFCEMCVKIISMGLVMHPGAYLRDAWNVLDGVIVVSSVLAVAFRDPGLVIVRSFRTLRALRPLRAIRRLRGMRLVMATLVKSLPQIGNVALFGLFQLVVFGILGVQLFAGKFWRCTDPSATHLDECVGTFVGPDGTTGERLWVNPVFNFDHIGRAMLTLFVVTTMDGWFDVTQRGADATEVDYQPVENHSPANVLYFLAFVVASGLFWVNLLIAAVIDNYRRLSVATGEMVFETPGQKRWAEALKMKQKQNLEAEEATREEPKFFIRKYIHRLVHWRWFEMLIIACIALNVVTMVTRHHGEPGDLTSFRKSANVAFTWIFIAEMALKVVALTPRGYAKDPWNRFDALIVAGSIPGIFGLDMGPGATLLRAFRLGRLFRLIQNAKGFRALFAALINSMGAMANVGSLLFLLLFIFSVLGMNLFGTLEHGQFIDDRTNFENFGNGMLTLFRIFSGDAWSRIMVDAMRCDLQENFLTGEYSTRCEVPLAPPLFFVSFIVLALFILLNLFVAVMVDNFTESAQSEGLLSTASFFDLLQRKMLLDGFVAALKRKLEEHRVRLGLDKKAGKRR